MKNSTGSELELLIVAGVIVVGYIIFEGFMKLEQSTTAAIGTVEQGAADAVTGVETSAGQIGSDLLYGGVIGTLGLLLLL